MRRTRGPWSGSTASAQAGRCPTTRERAGLPDFSANSAHKGLDRDRPDPYVLEMKLVPLFPDRSAAAQRRRRKQRLLIAALSLGALASVAEGGLVAVRHYWPQAQIK